MASHSSFYRSLARYRLRALAVFTIGCLAAAAAAIYNPRAFKSEAQWLVGEKPTEDAASSPEVESLIEIVRSRQLLDRVVMELGPHCILQGGPPQPEPVGATAADAHSHSPKQKIQTPQHVAAVVRLERSLLASSTAGGHVVTIACTAPSPAAAQHIVRAIGEAARREFEQRFPQPIERIAVPESAPASPPPSKDNTSPAELAVLHQRQTQVQSELSAVEARLQANNAHSQSTEETIASLIALLSAPVPTSSRPESDTAPPKAADLRQQLATLQSHEQELAAKMHDNHPQLVALRQQITDLQATFEQHPAGPRTKEPERVQSPVPERSRADLLATGRAKAQALAIERRTLVAAQKQLDRQLAELNAQVEAFSTVDEHPVAAVPVEPAQPPLVVNPPAPLLTLIQPATYNPQELSPGRAGVFAVGVLLSALCALVAAMLAAARNPLLCTPRQLGRIWNVPLVGTIPPDLQVMTAAS